MDNTSQNNFNENIESTLSVISFIDSPLKLITEARKLGVKGFKRFFLILFFFGFMNIIWVAIAISKIFLDSFNTSMIPYIILVFIVGIVFTAFASYQAYRYLIINALFAVYKNSTVLFQKLSVVIVDKVDLYFKSNTESNQKKLAAFINVGDLLQKNFNRIPSFFQKRLIKIINKIPLYNMVLDFKDDLFAGKKDVASAKLYGQMDGFITNSIFGNNNTRWVSWLILLNLIVQFAIIKFGF